MARASRIVPIEEALEEIRAGRIIVLMDDEDRENEGDLCVAAERVTAEHVNFMATHGRGLVCLALSEEQCDQLGLAMMVTENRAPLGTAFTVSVDARHGIGRGISAVDRATTIRTATRADVIEGHEKRVHTPRYHRPHREWPLVGVMTVAAVATGFLLSWASAQPHADALGEEEGSAPTSDVQLTPAQATGHFPAADVTSFRTIAQDTLDKLTAGDQAGATARIADLETAWDDDEASLKPKDGTAWTYLDGEIDQVLTSLRDPNPDPATEKQALTALLTTLQG